MVQMLNIQTNKRQRILKGQSRIDNPNTQQERYKTQNEDKTTNKQI